MSIEVYLSDNRSPIEDLATEEWLLDRAAEGQVCALACSWAEPVVVIGFGQDAEDVDLEYCQSAGIPVVRRITGGTGVVHVQDLGFSLALPIAHAWAEGITSVYARFLGVLEAALIELGSEARRMASPRKVGRDRSPICFEDQSSDTLLVGSRKAVGCAQTRRRRSVLIHAAILRNLDTGLYARIFNVDEERVERGLAPALAGVEWRRGARTIARHFADRLCLEINEAPAPDLDPDRLRPWTTQRWSPLTAEARGG